MSDVRYSRHARVRQQQRGIPQWMINLLLQFGRKQHDRKGVVRYSLDQQALQRIAHECDKKILVEVLANRRVYVVVSVEDERVVTVANRYH